jgi:subtilisin family serine protease
MLKKSLLATATALALTAPAYAGEDHKTRTQLVNTGTYAAWERGFTGKGIIIAILDTGLDPNHVDIKGKIVGAYNFYKTSTVLTEVKNGHGTAMASIAAGANNNDGVVGVAYDSRILFGQVGSGTSVDMRAAQRAALWAVNNGAQVANMSFTANFDTAYRTSLKASANEKGVYIVTDPTRNTGRAAYYGYVTEIAGFKAATDKGLILVMAAGNQGLPYAGAPGMLATATDSAGNLLLGGRTIIVGGVTSSFTPQAGQNRAGHICNKVTANGSCADLYRVKEFFVVAPGTTTAAAALTGNGTQVISGTSIATAYVTGAVAVLRQAWPQLRPEQTVQLIFRTAKDLGAPGVDEVFGWGMIDLDKATRPFGQLVANVPNKGPVPLQNSLVSTSGSLIAKSTSFLNGSQYEDEFGRNYTVPLGNAFQGRKSSFEHPYLSLDGNKVLVALETDNKTLLMSTDGAAVGVKANNMDYEVGVSHQTNQVLGTVMLGTTGVDSSTNVWAAVGKTYDLNSKWSVGAKAFVAGTAVNNNNSSVFRFNGPIVSTSLQATVTKKDTLFKSDALSLTVRPVNEVVAGSVDVTRVGGYTYTAVNDGEYYNATPTVETQRYKLGRFQDTQYTVSYSVMPTKNSKATINYSVAPGADSKVSARFTVLF